MNHQGKRRGRPVSADRRKRMNVIYHVLKTHPKACGAEIARHLRDLTAFMPPAQRSLEVDVSRARRRLKEQSRRADSASARSASTPPTPGQFMVAHALAAAPSSSLQPGARQVAMALATAKLADQRIAETFARAQSFARLGPAPVAARFGSVPGWRLAAGPENCAIAFSWCAKGRSSSP